MEKKTPLDRLKLTAHLVDTGEGAPKVGLRLVAAILLCGAFPPPHPVQHAVIHALSHRLGHLRQHQRGTLAFVVRRSSACCAPCAVRSLCHLRRPPGLRQRSDLSRNRSLQRMPKSTAHRCHRKREIPFRCSLLTSASFQPPQATGASPMCSTRTLSTDFSAAGSCSESRPGGMHFVCSGASCGQHFAGHSENGSAQTLGDETQSPSPETKPRQTLNPGSRKPEVSVELAAAPEP